MCVCVLHRFHIAMLCFVTRPAIAEFGRFLMDSMLCSSAFPPASAFILFSHVSQGQGSFVTFGEFVDLLVYFAFFQYPETDLFSEKVRLLCTVRRVA
jgi:hypothetical protein